MPYAELARGFPCEGAWIRLVGPQGVFKSKELPDGPLTLLSTLASSYEDEHLEGDEVLYDYVPRSREHENDGPKRIAASGRKVMSHRAGMRLREESKISPCAMRMGYTE